MMDEKRKGIISEPDENGVRYYTIGQGMPSGADEEERNAGVETGSGNSGSGSSGSGGNGSGSGNFGNGGFGGGSGMSGGGLKKSKKKPLIIFGCILLAVILLGVACSAFDSDDSSDYADLSEDHISILHISGTISGEDSSDSLSGSGTYNHQWVLNRLDDVIGNPNNKGLILFVDTPGGAVYETDEIYYKLLEYKETGRPLYSAMGSMAASGGYYISAPADKIIANRNCWTGSIGVTIGTLYDVSELLDKYGIKTVTITSGKNKAMGSSVEPMTEEQKEIFQSLVDEAYDQFTGIVAEGRNMPIKKVKKLADGRIYTAKQALNNGLIDQIGTLDDAISDMKKTYGLGDCQISDMEYTDDSLFSSIFGKLASAQKQNQSDVAALLEIMESQGDVPISYMAEMRK